MMRPREIVVVLVCAALASAVEAATGGVEGYSAALDIRWDDRNPAVAEQRLQGELAQWLADDPRHLIVATQIARAQGLLHRVAEAHGTLDAVVARLDGMPSLVRIRYLLERGRLFQAAGAYRRAAPLIAQALELAVCAGEAPYIGEAAGMLDDAEITAKAEPSAP
jgi:hypothetical protein